MLDHQPDYESVLEQRILVIERQFGEEHEHGFAHLPYIVARGLRRQDGQPSALAAGMSERVVEVVVLRRHRAPPTDASQEPQLLEVADMGEIPDERRLQRRDLHRELVVGERLQERQRAVARVLESDRKAQTATPSSARRLKMSDATMEPSPTAAATRFVEPCLTSPAANSPTRLVSSGRGSRSSGQQSGMPSASRSWPVRM